MIKIDQLAKPYRGQPQRNDNGYRFFGRRDTNNHFVEGIKYFPNGDIAVGTYDRQGLLHGQNCMYFFKDELYTFGTYEAGELRTGEVYFLGTKSVEKGPRNAQLHLDGPGCQRILADQTVYNGTFSDGTLDSGTISYANGTIVSVGRSTPPPLDRALREEIKDRISNLSEPYLSAPLIKNTDGHRFYLLKRNGGHTEGIRKFKNGDIAIGSFDENGLLTGPNGMYFFAANQIFVFGFNIDGNLRDGEVRYLNTNEIEFGSRNEQLRLNGPDCRRVLTDGTVERGTFRNGRLEIGTITYPNGSSEVVFESSSISQISKIEPSRINTKIQEYNPLRMRSPYTFPPIQNQYSEGQDLIFPTRLLETKNQWGFQSSTNSNSTESQLLAGLGISLMLGMITVALYFLRLLGRTRIYTTYRATQDNNPAIAGKKAKTRQVQRAWNRTHGLIDETGKVHQQTVYSRFNLPQLGGDKTHGDRLKQRIPAFNLIQQGAGDLLPLGDTIAFDKTRPVFILGPNPIYLTADEADPLAQSVTYHINLKRDWVPLLEISILKRIIPNAVSIVALNEISELRQIAEFVALTYPHQAAKLERLSPVLATFQDQFEKLSTPSEYDRKLSLQVSNTIVTPVQNFSEEIAALITRLEPLVSGNITHNRTNALELLQETKQRLMDEIHAQTSRIKALRTICSKINKALPLKEYIPEIHKEVDVQTTTYNSPTPVSRYQLQMKGLARLARLETQVVIWNSEIRKQLNGYKEDLDTTEFKEYLSNRVTLPGWIELQEMLDRLSEIHQQLLAINDATPESQLHPQFPTDGKFNRCKLAVRQFIRTEALALKGLRRSIAGPTHIPEHREADVRSVLGVVPRPMGEPMDSISRHTPKLNARSNRVQTAHHALEAQWNNIMATKVAAEQLLDTPASPGQLGDQLMDLHQGVVDYLNQSLRMKYKGDPNHKQNTEKFRELLVHQFHQHPALCHPELSISLNKKLAYLVRLVNEWELPNTDNPHIARWHYTPNCVRPAGNSIDPIMAWHSGVRDILHTMRWIDISAPREGNRDRMIISGRRFAFASACVVELIDHAPNRPSVQTLRQNLCRFPDYTNRLNRNLMMHSVEGDLVRWSKVILDESSHDELQRTATKAIEILESAMVDMSNETFPPLGPADAGI